MGASGPVWSVIVAVIAGLVLIDYLFSVRRGHTPTLREAAVWSAIRRDIHGRRILRLLCQQ